MLFKEVPTGAIHLPSTEKPKVSINTLRTVIRDGSVVLVDLNGAGRMIKRIQYFEENGTWTIFLIADNDDWAKENDYPRVIIREDDLIIYGEIVAREEQL